MTKAFVSSSSQYYSLTSAVVNAYPVTMACWFVTYDLTTERILMYVGQNASANRLTLAAHGAQAGDPIAALDRGTSAQSAFTTVAYKTDIWQHAAGVFRSASSRSAYLNAGSVATNSSSSGNNPATWSRTRIGVTDFGPLGGYMNGLIAVPAIWNAELSPGEILALATGEYPRNIRPESLIFFPEDVGTGPVMADPYRGIVLSPTNDPREDANLPPVRYPPRNARIYSFPSGVIGSFKVAWAKNANGLILPYGT